MTPDPPIIVLGMPRSGTSMVAGLFARHGVWVGTCREPDTLNAKGHFENLPVKRYHKREIGPTGVWSNKGRVPEPWDGIAEETRRLIADDGYAGGPWLFKCAPVFWRLLDPLEPSAWVCVRRKPDGIRESGRSSGIFRPEDGAIARHTAIMDRIRDERGGADVMADQIVRGDYSSLRRALRVCGIEMDEGVVGEFVDPNLWRHG